MANNMKNRKEIWTVELSDIVSEEGINDMLCARIYESANEAICAAQEIVKGYIGDERVIEAVVYQGEYIDDNGNIFGSPYDIYCATNASPYESAKKRASSGFCGLYVDFYAEDPVIPCEYIDYDNHKFMSAVIVSPLSEDMGGEWVIAEEALSKLLISPEGKPFSRRAEMMDSTVYAYCPPEWFTLPESEFVKRIVKTFT